MTEVTVSELQGESVPARMGQWYWHKVLNCVCFIASHQTHKENARFSLVTLKGTHIGQSTEWEKELIEREQRHLTPITKVAVQVSSGV